MSKLRSAVFIMISPFSRIANKINWRFGRKFRFQDNYTEYIGNKLKPGMVVLSHKNYELTNLFIKGYWTHAAMVVSNNEIVEALSSGVMKNEVNSFFSKSDDFIILEPTVFDADIRNKAISYIKTKIGSPYNFSFIQCDDKFTCSDLVTRAYDMSITGNQESESQGFGLLDYLTSEVLYPEQVLQQQDQWKVVVDTTRCNNDVLNK